MNKIMRTARITNGYNQIEFSELIGVTNDYISRIELKNLIPSPKIAQKIAFALGKNVDELFYNHSKIVD